MSTENTPPAPPTSSAASPAPKKGGAGAMLVGVVVSAVLSGGAAFGGARAASKAPKQEAEIIHVHPPGPTVSLEPFLASVPDATGKVHAVKLTLAIELGREAKEEEFKAFIPRVRDAILSYLRTMTFEKLADKEGIETLRKELLERLKTVGAEAEQMLVTDLITQ